MNMPWSRLASYVTPPRLRSPRRRPQVSASVALSPQQFWSDSAIAASLYPVSSFYVPSDEAIRQADQRFDAERSLYRQESSTATLLAAGAGSLGVTVVASTDGALWAIVPGMVAVMSLGLVVVSQIHRRQLLRSIASQRQSGVSIGAVRPR